MQYILSYSVLELVFVVFYLGLYYIKVRNPLLGKDYIYKVTYVPTNINYHRQRLHIDILSLKIRTRAKPKYNKQAKDLRT